MVRILPPPHRTSPTAVTGRPHALRAIMRTSALLSPIHLPSHPPILRNTTPWPSLPSLTYPCHRILPPFSYPDYPIPPPPPPPPFHPLSPPPLPLTPSPTFRYLTLLPPPYPLPPPPPFPLPPLPLSPPPLPPPSSLLSSLPPPPPPPIPSPPHPSTPPPTSTPQSTPSFPPLTSPPPPSSPPLHDPSPPPEPSTLLPPRPPPAQADRLHPCLCTRHAARSAGNSRSAAGLTITRWPAPTWSSTPEPDRPTYTIRRDVPSTSRPSMSNSSELLP